MLHCNKQAIPSPILYQQISPNVTANQSALLTYTDNEKNIVNFIARIRKKSATGKNDNNINVDRIEIAETNINRTHDESKNVIVSKKKKKLQAYLDTIIAFFIYD